MSGYPVQPSKVQPPPLRDETLPRERLLDWLHDKVHLRLVYVIAEAGYGKTTLLADFTRRTRVRTLWYRLDEEDRNWIAFLSHLVAAGRQHDESFAAATVTALSQAAQGATADRIVHVFLRDLDAIAEFGVTLILDDFHLVDDSDQVRSVLEALIARAPERMSFVVASRRAPNLHVARLRSQGEVAELRTDSLRFSEAETERLFREAYATPLEADVVADLSRRTDGWAASLHLVQAAIRGRTRSEVRSFIRTLNGKEGALHDYLAEEVVGRLPATSQRFLEAVAILDDVEPEYASVVTDLAPDEASQLLDAATSAGLIQRPSGRGGRGGHFHRLVREFLIHRLEDARGSTEVKQLHCKVAEYAMARDWRVAARHFSAAGAWEALEAVLSRHLATIASQGAYQEAAAFLRPAGRRESPTASVLLARLEIQRGRLDFAERHADEAVAGSAPGSSERALALATLLTAKLDRGEGDEARGVAQALLASTADPTLVAIANASLHLVDTSGRGYLPAIRVEFEAMAEEQKAAGQLHYFGITALNIADCLRVEGRFEDAIRIATESIEALERSSGGIEIAMSQLVRAWAEAHLNGIQAAESDIARALAVDSPTWSLLIQHEAADIHRFYGDPTRIALAREPSVGSLPPSVALPVILSRAWQAIRDRHLELAMSLLDRIPRSASASTTAIQSASGAARAIAAALSGSGGVEVINEALDVAAHQGANMWLTLSQIASASIKPRDEFAQLIRPLLERQPAYASMAAELITERLDDLSEADLALVRDEVQLRPERWRRALIRQVESDVPSLAVRAGSLLEVAGESSDIPRLRALSRRWRRVPGAAVLGRGLARKLAPRVQVDDLGRVVVRIGSHPVPSASIRRKVLALLCFLLVQHDYSATRDQVLDALWPEQDPAQALNSLNQTIYFLRRVFEPGYVEDLSPGYVHHDGELIWLDQDLVSSRAAQCRDLLQQLPANPSPGDVEALALLYTGRFALDFEYDEWAQEYRDWLHGAYLEAMERAIHSDTHSGHYSRGIRLAQHALAVEPSAEQVELSLLRLYRLSGAHAAAAEQYAHYASVLREQLGVDPPALDAI